MDTLKRTIRCYRLRPAIGRVHSTCTQHTVALPASRLRASVGGHQAVAGATAGTDATHGFLTPPHHACAVRRCHGWLGVPRRKTRRPRCRRRTPRCRRRTPRSRGGSPRCRGGCRTQTTSSKAAPWSMLYCGEPAIAHTTIGKHRADGESSQGVQDDGRGAGEAGRAMTTAGMTSSPGSTLPTFKLQPHPPTMGSLRAIAPARHSHPRNRHTRATARAPRSTTSVHRRP